MRAHLFRLVQLAVPLFLLTSAACPYSHLEGSIDSDLSLDFNQLRLRKQEANLLIEYLRETRDGSEKVCKVVVDTEGLELPAGGSFDLGEELFLDHVTLQRSTFEGDEQFPAMEKGSMPFEEIDFRDDGFVKGSFEILFEGSRSLKGWFEGYLEEL